MKKKTFCKALCLLAAFVLWTAALSAVDVAPIGPEGTRVGFSTLNGLFHGLTGVHLSLYGITDRLSLLPLGVIAGFGLLGLKQWRQRKHLLRVDRSILALGGFYLLVLAAFLLFEVLAVNYRPILIDGRLEASYPSSTTMLVMCVMPTAAMQLRARMKEGLLRRLMVWLLWGFTVGMVAARLLSGVHWLTDIVGGALLSGGLVLLYCAVDEAE